MTQPALLPATDEIRRLMHLDWADGAGDGRPLLQDADRAARLYGIVADPYYRRAFGKLGLNDLALLCIYRMMESGQWAQAFRSIARLDRMERDIARGRPSLDPATSARRPAPAPRPAVPPATTPRVQASPPPMSAGELLRDAGAASKTRAHFQHLMSTTAPFT